MGGVLDSACREENHPFTLSFVLLDEPMLLKVDQFMEARGGVGHTTYCRDYCWFKNGSNGMTDA